jgi:hypothetical protein
MDRYTHEFVVKSHFSTKTMFDNHIIQISQITFDGFQSGFYQFINRTE